MLKISAAYLEYQKSFISTKNIKCTKSTGQFFFQPADAAISCNSPSIYGTESILTIFLFEKKTTGCHFFFFESKHFGISHIGFQSSAHKKKTNLRFTLFETVFSMLHFEFEVVVDNGQIGFSWFRNGNPDISSIIFILVRDYFANNVISTLFFLSTKIKAFNL